MYQNTPRKRNTSSRSPTARGSNLTGPINTPSPSPKGKLPPVKGFWSLTVYNAENFFHANELNRFSLGTKNKDLQFGADGSLTLYLGERSPGKDKEFNWLPAPNGTFSLLLRNYWPDQAVIDGTWVPPDAVRAN